MTGEASDMSSRQCPECSATGMGQFPICKQKWDLFRISVTACTIDKNTFSALFGIFYNENGNLKRNFPKKNIYKPLMGCSLFSNSHFQMGVTVMGFAEHFGLGPVSPLFFYKPYVCVFNLWCSLSWLGKRKSTS